MTAAENQALAQYRTLINKSSDGILMADVETKLFRYANPAAARMFGYSENELCTMGVTDLHPKEVAKHVLVAFESMSQGKQGAAIDVPCLKKDGSTVFADITVAALTVDGRAVTAGFFRDVTSRRAAQSALEASETRYRRLFESAKDGVLILDACTGQIVDVNPYLIELTGYSREHFLGKHIWEIGPFKDIAASRESFVALQASEYVRYDDLPLQTSDGRKIDVEFVSNVYLVDGQKVIQCNVRDISQRKQADVERTRLAMAIEQVRETVFITDAAGVIEYVNPEFERVSGYTRAEAIGQTPGLLKSGAHDDAFYETLWGTITKGRSWSGRFVNKRKDGSRYSEEAIISPILDAVGAVTSYVGVQRDVTATLELEAQFRQAQKMEAVGQLAGGVAHDFNNILSVILSYAEIMSEELRPGEPFRAEVEEIKQAAWRASDLTKQLLAFSRQQKLEPKVVSLNQTLAGVQKLLRRLMGVDIDLTMLPTNGLWNIKIDPGQIEQVLMNLAVNACDAMPLGGNLTIETLNVELDEDYARVHADVRAGEYVAIVVTDTGTGMTKETQTHIFEPFFTTKDKSKGTGLGLATVFGIIKQSGGHIWVYSELGVGTTFKMYFPRVLGVVEPQPAVRLRRELQRGTETILLVEDEDQVRAVAADILRRQGYVVLEAPNGGEALLICEQHGAKIDLLLTDVVLPRMNGRQLAARLAPLRPEMKVVFMSGYTDDAILQHGILDSGVAYLQKPLTPVSLTRKVREAFDTRIESDEAFCDKRD